MKIINRFFLIIISIIILGCKTLHNDSSIYQPKNVKFQSTDNLKQIIFKGVSVEISVEKIIYNLSLDNSNYYLKFIIKNISNKRIGFDLTNSVKQIYPNYWCFYCSVNKGVNEGGRIIQSNNNYQQLKDNFNKDKITIINSNEEFHYYRNICKYDNEVINFNEIKNPEDFFRIRLDGQLVITDGQSTEEYRLDNKSVEKRLVIFNNPILKEQIPNDEKQFVYKVITERPRGR